MNTNGNGVDAEKRKEMLDLRQNHQKELGTFHKAGSVVAGAAHAVVSTPVIVVTHTALAAKDCAEVILDHAAGIVRDVGESYEDGKFKAECYFRPSMATDVTDAKSRLGITDEQLSKMYGISSNLVKRTAEKSGALQQKALENPQVQASLHAADDLIKRAEAVTENMQARRVSQQEQVQAQRSVPSNSPVPPAAPSSVEQKLDTLIALMTQQLAQAGQSVVQAATLPPAHVPHPAGS